MGYHIREKMKVNEKEKVEDVLGYPIRELPDRGITKETCEYFGVRVALSQEDGKTVEAMYFPYTKDGKITGFKKKDLTIPKGGRGHFTTVGEVKIDCELFGQSQGATGGKKVFITEGECFPPDAEVLTEAGWVSFEEYTDQKVLQVNEALEGEFVDPLAKVKKPFEGDLIEFSSGSYYSLTTPEHNLVRFSHKGKLIKRKANDEKAQYLPLPRVLNSVTTAGNNWSSDQVRLLVMLSADFTFRESGDLYALFKKARKITRACSLLDSLNVRYSCKKGANGYTSVFIHRGHGLEEFCQKEFDHTLIGQLSFSQIKVFLEEVVHWDGNTVPNRAQVEYSSKYYTNAAFVQTLAHMVGYTSTIINRKNDFGSWYKVSILFKKKTSSTQKGYKKVSYSGDVFCVTVPSGMLLVRQKGSISVSGNCDALAAFQILKENYPSGTPTVLSIGLGTANAAKHIGNNLKYVQKFSQTVLAFDMDAADEEDKKKKIKRGKEATEDVARLIPNILVAEFSEKDPNDMLLKDKGKDLYWALVSKAKPFVPEEISFGGEISLEELLTPLEEGVRVACLPKLMDKLHGLRIPELTIVLAPTKAGKTTICKEIGYALVKDGHFVGHLFLEETIQKTQQSYLALDNNVLLPAFREDPSIVPREKLEASYKELIHNGRTIYLKANKITPESVLRDMRYMAAMGAKYIILDHLSYVFSGDANSDERKAIDLLLTELAAFKKEADVHLIVIAHIRRKDFIPKKDKEGNVIYPYWKPVSKEDGRGSGAFEQLCDNLVVIEPEITEKGERGRIRLKVEANREWDDTGIADVVIMDRNTGHLVAADNIFDF